MRALTTLGVLASLAAAAAIAVAFARYPGSPSIFALFNVSFIALAAAAIPRPRAYVYTVLAAMLTLGFWAKTIVHTIWAAAPFIEPVGDFSNSPAEWDEALLAMAAAAAGVLAARVLHFSYAYRRRDVVTGAAAPSWFVKYRSALWSATIAGFILLNAANLHFAFLQIGINAKLLLPLRLHVLLAWLVNIGFALWITVLLWWDFLIRPATLGRTVTIAFLEALASSVSVLSRIAYLIHAAPYWLALWEARGRLAAALDRRRVAVLGAVFAVFFVASVLAVFVLRAYYYPDNADLARNIKLEIPQLVVERWVGLEGVLVAGAVPDRSPALLAQVLADSPKSGTEAIYQRTAKTRYRADEARRFVFLTSAGPVALLLFSGSLLIVALGMAAIAIVLLATEAAAARWTGNPFFLAVSGAGLANVVCQTTFFYLTMIFVLQMWVALAAIALLSRTGK